LESEGMNQKFANILPVIPVRSLGSYSHLGDRPFGQDGSMSAAGDPQEGAGESRAAWHLNRAAWRSVVVWLSLVSGSVIASPVSVYFGTGGTESKGIYRASFEPENGKLSRPELVAEIGSPGFLAFSPDRSRLYAVGSLGNKPVVAGYGLGADGSLSLINSAPIGDGSGTHVAVHPSGKFLLTVQYGGGSVALFPLDSGGRVGAPNLIEHQGGSDVVPSRQESPHPHWCGFSPDGRFALVPDLGLDVMVVYRIDENGTALERHGVIPAPPGGGPRHMRFSADGKLIYLLNELSLEVTSYVWNPESGTAGMIRSVKALPEDVKAKEMGNSAAEILVHPSGRFVYSSNRGHDSVTVYRVGREKGELVVAEIEPISGAVPRNINLDPSGRWLLAAGADSNTISVFAIDPESGELSFQPKGIINVPSPICVAFGR
jgi:6-phosphogluconolactonase